MEEIVHYCVYTDKVEMEEHGFAGDLSYHTERKLTKLMHDDPRYKMGLIRLINIESIYG